MSLINCSECSKEISSLAVNCPHCGAPHKAPEVTIERKNFEVALLAIPFIGIALIFLWVGNMNLLQSPEGSLRLIAFGVILSTATLIYLEAKSLGMGIDKKLGNNGPWNWFIGVALLWIFIYPAYLFKRRSYGAKNRLFIGIFTALLFVGSLVMMSSYIEAQKASIREKIEQINEQVKAMNQ